MKSELLQSVNYIKKYSTLEPKIGIVLGSGLGSFADQLDERVAIPSTSIPYYPASTVEGHKGYLVFGTSDSIPLLAIQGRTHFYEGYSSEKITYIVRIMSRLGIKILIVTNAAGGINPILNPGDLMLVTDHINNMFFNPLRGSFKYSGPRFPDMSDAYSSKYYSLIEETAIENYIALRRGVLYTSTGPSYETAAEVKMITRMGADAASMSTIPEVIVANQAGLDVIGISCITNMATGISKRPLSHEEVTDTANMVKGKFFILIKGIIRKLIPS
jgi:purine-nucleoside phosphorylase